MQRLLDLWWDCSLAFVHFFSCAQQRPLTPTLRNKKHKKGMEFVAYKTKINGETQNVTELLWEIDEFFSTSSHQWEESSSILFSFPLLPINIPRVGNEPGPLQFAFPCLSQRASWVLALQNHILRETRELLISRRERRYRTGQNFRHSLCVWRAFQTPFVSVPELY